MLEIFGGPDRDRTDDLFHAMEARSQLRHRPTRKGQLSYCRGSGPASQTRRWREKAAALRATAGFERGHVLVLVHEEELAMAEALGFAGPA